MTINTASTGVTAAKFPTLEAAVSHLGERVLGAPIVIETDPLEATPEETQAELESLENDCRAKAQLLEALYARLADKDATIRRLKEKLAVTAEVMQDNVELKAEKERLTARWHAAEERRKLLDADYTEAMKNLSRYGQFTCNLAKALGWSTHEVVWEEVVTEVRNLRRWKTEATTVMSRWDMVAEFIQKHPDSILGHNVSDTVLAWLKERDTLKAELDKTRSSLEESRRERARLCGLLDTCQSGNRTHAAKVENLKAELLSVRETWQKDHMEMKQRLDAATQVVTPQYRMLEVGEELREDDEVNVGSDGWIPYGAFGGHVKSDPKGINPVGYYRRKL